LQRLEAEEQEQRQRAIAQATADPSNAEVGVLVLEPVASEIRNVAAQKFAQIMQLDPTLHGIHQSGWRLWTGRIGELRLIKLALSWGSLLLGNPS